VSVLVISFCLQVFIELAPRTSPPPTSDFPGGEGESRFLNRGGQEHIQGETGLRALGFKKFDTPEGASLGETQAVLEANSILFPEVSEL
jgi:hypothetical protein